VWKRIAVVVAGPVANFLLAIAVFAGAIYVSGALHLGEVAHRHAVDGEDEVAGLEAGALGGAARLHGAVVVAGPVANFLLAIAVFAGAIYVSGRYEVSPRVSARPDPSGRWSLDRARWRRWRRRRT
jgi:membrane-associated protease RseP (regulator of RpoE activity)